MGGEVQRIVQQAAVGDGPRRELAARTRDNLAIKYAQATQELEVPLIERAHRLQQGEAAQQQQIQAVEKQTSLAKQEANEALKNLVDVHALQVAAEKIDQRVRVLEKLGERNVRNCKN